MIESNFINDCYFSSFWFSQENRMIWIYTIYDIYNRYIRAKKTTLSLNVNNNIIIRVHTFLNTVFITTTWFLLVASLSSSSSIHLFSTSMHSWIIALKSTNNRPAQQWKDNTVIIRVYMLLLPWNIYQSVCASYQIRVSKGCSHLKLVPMLLFIAQIARVAEYDKSSYFLTLKRISLEHLNRKIRRFNPIWDKTSHCAVPPVQNFISEDRGKRLAKLAKGSFRWELLRG